MEGWVIATWPRQLSALIPISWQHLGCIPLLRFKRKSQLKKQFVTTGFALSLRRCWDRYMDTVEDPAGTTKLTTCSRCHGDRTAANLRKGIAGATGGLILVGLNGE